MRIFTLVAVVAVANANLALSQAPAAKLADELAKIDSAAFAEGEREAASKMVADYIRARRRSLTEKNTEAWNAVKSKEDWRQFVKPKLEALRASLGEFPPVPQSLDMRITSTVEGDGFKIDNLVFQSRPGLWVTANLYRPAKPRESMPGILICHAHHTPKEHGELQDMGMTWARAGCLVLVMDQLGHGERRQHPFVDASSYPKPYRTTRQDYHFRYDSGIQLHLAGDSLIGWMAWDLMRGVDLLLAQKGIDPKRIILLGSVAGGGDPAAVVGALDKRIACVVPFNFGHPSPWPQYPHPLDKPPDWNFAGGGSWESTRNLRNSVSDGFLPWVIVAGVAPRNLIYAQEFAWFREGDPAWKRLQTVYGFYDAADKLAFTFGKGDVTKKPPEASHCTHIGPTHRKLMHEAFRKWFNIDVTPETEFSQRVPPEKLRCWTPEAERELRPRKLLDLLAELSVERLEKARKSREGKTPAEQRRQMQDDFARVLGTARPCDTPVIRAVATYRLTNATAERIVLTTEPGIRVPLLLLIPKAEAKAKFPVVVALCQSGKAALTRERAADIAALLESGVAVCLPDVRGTGESGLGTGRGHSSAATSISSSQLMLGEPLVAGQLRDARSVLAYLRTRPDLDAGRLALWGDSLAKVNPPGTQFVIPRDDDSALPPQSEPLGGMLTLLTALYEDDVQAVYIRNGLVGFRSVLDRHLVSIPHDVVVPGLLTVGDLNDLAGACAPMPLYLGGLVDGSNLRMGEQQVRQAFKLALNAYEMRKSAAGLTIDDKPVDASSWLINRLMK